MAKMTVDELRSQLSGLEEYQPEDEATLRQRATDIYSPQYQQDLQNLRDQIEFQVNQQQRNAVKTGMQRSSYNAAQQASIRRGGLQSEAQLAGTYEGNIANTLYNLLEKEKDRKDSADQYRNQLLLQLYNLENGSGSGGSGSGSGSDSDDTNTSGLGGAIGGTLAQGLLNALNGLKNTSGTSNPTRKIGNLNGNLYTQEGSLTPQRDINTGLSQATSGNTLGGSSLLSGIKSRNQASIEDANRKLTMPKTSALIR